jgi:type VI protein secretion system component VasF
MDRFPGIKETVAWAAMPSLSKLSSTAVAGERVFSVLQDGLNSPEHAEFLQHLS